MPLFDHGEHANSLNAPNPAEAVGLPAYPVSIHLGSPARDLTGNWKLSDGSVDPHVFSEKDVVITISPKKPDMGGPIIADGVQGTAGVSAFFEVPRSAPQLLPAQEYLFLVDRSGSMHGSRISQVRDALRIMVKSLPGPYLATASFVSHRLVFMANTPGPHDISR